MKTVLPYARMSFVDEVAKQLWEPPESLTGLEFSV